MTGIQLERSEERGGLVDELAALRDGRVGLAGVLGSLGHQARRSSVGRLLGRAVDTAYRWDAPDSRDPRWWPQGITSSADAGEAETVAGRRLLVTSWYAKDLGAGSHGSRVTVLDLESLRYEHVLLVVPERADDGSPRTLPLEVHAGGIVWRGRRLHVAATTRGVYTCDLDDVLRASPEEESAYGHRFVLPVDHRHRSLTDEGVERFRYSFLSLDRSIDPPGLLAGEYGRAGATTRLALFAMTDDGELVADEAGRSRPTWLEDAGLSHMQGAVWAAGRHHVTTSHGPWRPGSVHGKAPDRIRAHQFAVPMGPEDLTWWPGTDRLWTVTEHPRRRWVVSAPRARFG